MKKNVVLSSYCLIISSVLAAVVSGIAIYASKQPDNGIALCILGCGIFLLCMSTLFYMPLSISLSQGSLRIHRPLRTKVISMSEIADAALCSPTMGAVRICGSGGWFGWYGWFRENDLGRYFAYYGKASDCFLVTLKNGRKYMLGCTEAPDMVKAIKNGIRK